MKIAGTDTSYPKKEPNRTCGMFGYESEMLNIAATFDDVEGFAHWMGSKYPDGRNVFALESKDFYGRTLLSHCIFKGAPLCVRWLYEQGCREGEKSLDELMREAAAFRMKRELPQAARAVTWEPELQAA